MGLREEYKQTEVGVIPEDWEVKKCIELGSFYKGKGISSKDLVADGLPCIMYGDIYVKYDTKFSNPDFRITKQTAANSSLAKTGDLLFTGSGETAEEIGKCVVYQGDDDIYIGGDIIALTPNSDNDSLFLAYMQNSKMLLSQKANLGQGHTVVHIYTEHIKSLNMPLPPTKAEQTAIATALSDTDALIQSLTALIAKKRNIKKGAMQELLKPKDGWMKKKLVEVAEVRKGQLITESTRISGNIPVIAGGKTPAYYHSKPNRLGKTITISGSGANAGYVSIHNYPIFASDCSTLSESSKYSIEYIFYILQLLQDKIYKMQTGGAQPHIHPNDINPIEIPFPKPEEQTRIATILSNMDKEITELEAKLEKYKLIKQGMMQELLTGKTRLI
jgi:type I restriction enzyme, S subunit